MEQLAVTLIGIACLLTPAGALALAGLTYLAGMGAVQFPGISRGDRDPSKEWTTVPELAHKGGDALGAFAGLAGVGLGLLGFLLPWVNTRFTLGTGSLHPGGLNGSLSGVALMFQSLLVAVDLISEAGIGVGALLLLFAAAIALVPLALIVSGLVALGMVSVPLGLTRNLQSRFLARALLITVVLALGLSCALFGAAEATTGGLAIGGRSDTLGRAYSLSISVDTGFWVTVGGLLLALVGALLASVLGSSLDKWARRLVSMELPEGEQEAPAKKGTTPKGK